MRGSQTLMEAMEAVAHSVDTMLPPASPPAPKAKPASKPLSELEAFMQLDPLLTDLNKEFLNMKARAKELAQKNGYDDPMAEMAAEAEDSAWCRMQTRYLELRSERQLMARAQRLMREEELKEAKEKREKEREEKKKKDIAFMRLLMTFEKLKKKMDYTDTFVILFLAIFFQKEDDRLRNLANPMHHSYAA